MLRNVLLFLLHCYYGLLEKTVRLEVVGLPALLAEMDKGNSPVVACAHNALVPVLLSFKRQPATVVASQSKDGELIAHVLEQRGFEVVRGSSSRGGTAALLRMLEAAERGRTLGITVDGPRGPALIPKKGISLCAAKSSGSPYFAVALPVPGRFFKQSFSVRLGSWDRFLLPLPFCKLKIEFLKIEISNQPRANNTAWRSAFLEKLEELLLQYYGFLAKASK